MKEKFCEDYSWSEFEPVLVKISLIQVIVMNDVS